ncbi:lysophospholipase [Hahella sp. CCB-MM4]|uniref:alpha/beta fold hydrolase n=1 Tax=Hahella sp. (strain CCB-MM4) TaxID=1926491 RepID=UPI000B9B5105|nr:alpha/beta hydrolase [Hahella sp. CCB-MM4]OZG73505.1 lysophospholipase [Hahella sp. CCB-MM4]
MQYQESDLASAERLDESHSPDTIESIDGHQITLYKWLPQNRAPKGVFQIVHGMAEHSARYEHLAKALTEQGFMVIAHDHRGHGRSARGKLLGHYDDKDGWRKVVGDVNLVYQYCQQHCHQGPHVLFAHSMGSFITMGFLMNYPTALSGLILSGSNYSPPIKFKAAVQIARLEKLRLGARTTSKFLDFLSFGSFNDHFKPNRTSHDWLSRDTEQVDRYINDPACGFIATTQLWCDFLGGLRDISASRNLRKLPKNIPYYLLSGDRDPVGGMGKGVKELSRKLKNSGVQQLNCRLYPDGRHEMLNETNKDEVIQDMVKWLEQHHLLPDSCHH